MGTKKNHRSPFEQPKHMFKLMGKKIITNLLKKIFIQDYKRCSV